MNRLTIDEAGGSQLVQLDEAELCDQSGRKVGHFLSEELYRRLLYDWANARISDEELERRRRQPGGRTLAEIWRRLQES